jgi:hypothetical protein
MDIETTGIGMKCQVIEIGAVIDDLYTPISPVGALPMFHCYVAWPMLQGEPYAFWMHGQSNLLKKLADRSSKYLFLKPEEVWTYFLGFIDKYMPFNRYGQINVAGKNFGYFDANRLEQLPEWPGPYNGGKSIWSHKFIDPGNLFWNPLEDTETLPNTKKVNLRCGMDGMVAHTALDDALGVVKQMRVWMKSKRPAHQAMLANMAPGIT